MQNFSLLSQFVKPNMQSVQNFVLQNVEFPQVYWSSCEYLYSLMLTQIRKAPFLIFYRHFELRFAKIYVFFDKMFSIYFHTLKSEE